MFIDMRFMKFHEEQRVEIGVVSGPELRLGFWDRNIDQKLEEGDWVGVSPF